MSDDERARRPTPERTGPIRAWRPTAAGEPNAPPREGEDPLRSVIARSVELGYRVVDEYIAQGQRAARLFNERQLDAEAAAREAPELFSRWLRSASDFASLWLEFASLAQSPRAPDPSAAPATPPSPAAPAPARELALALEIHSSRRTEARLDLRPGAMAQALAVHDLRSADPEKPRLRARCERDEASGAPVVVVDIPDDQPGGSYSGVLVDETTSVPIGSVTVRVV